MLYRHHGIIAGLLISLFTYVAGIAYDLRATISERIAEPILSFIRASPVSAEFSLLQNFKVIAFGMIKALKPEYRDGCRPGW